MLPDVEQNISKEEREELINKAIEIALRLNNDQLREALRFALSID